MVDKSLGWDACRSQPLLKSQYLGNRADFQRDMLQKLSAKEWAVCQRILQGCTSEAVALQLGVAKSTVLTHRKSIYRTLGIVSQAEFFGMFGDWAWGNRPLDAGSNAILQARPEPERERSYQGHA